MLATDFGSGLAILELKYNLTLVQNQQQACVHRLR